MNSDYLSLQGKVALVTGGSRGIGRAIALAFADAGADVVISSRKIAKLEEVAQEIRALDRRVLPVAAHNRQPDDLRRLMEVVKGEFGRLDILVNNAATNPVMAPLIDTEEKAFDVIMNTQMAAKMMIEQGGNGNILNISSIGGISPDKGLGVYCISKAAINMLTRALALELGEYNIRVNAIAPGVVQTYFSQVLWSNEALMAQEMEHTPLKRIAQPEEVARIALTIVSEAAAYITGQVIVMDGGGTL